MFPNRVQCLCTFISHMNIHVMEVLRPHISIIVRVTRIVSLISLTCFVIVITSRPYCPNSRYFDQTSPINQPCVPSSHRCLQFTNASMFDPIDPISLPKPVNSLSLSLSSISNFQVCLPCSRSLNMPYFALKSSKNGGFSLL